MSVCGAASCQYNSTSSNSEISTLRSAYAAERLGGVGRAWLLHVVTLLGGLAVAEDVAMAGANGAAGETADAADEAGKAADGLLSFLVRLLQLGEAVSELVNLRLQDLHVS